MKRILFAIFFFLATACTSSSQISESDRAIDLMTISFAKTLPPEDFRLIGLGGGIDHATGKQKKINITLITSKKICELKNARALLVGTITNFLSYINSRDEIKEYLAVTPFTIENIRLSIIYENAQPGEIVDMANTGLILYYYRQDQDPNVLNWVDAHEETFEEAKNILLQEELITTYNTTDFHSS